MNLRYITCSDIREDVPVRDAIELLKINPKVELGIQAHGGAMNFGTPCYQWLDQLLGVSANAQTPLNIAVHVNYDWCSQMVVGGHNIDMWPAEIKKLMLRKNKDGIPLIRRWQLNIGDGTRGIIAPGMAQICVAFQNREFIFPYNAKNPVTAEIEKLALGRIDFSLLYDSSYGAGISPSSWNGPVYKNHPMGYAGGLGPDNVADNLEKIAMVCPPNYTAWIDAEGRLMKPGTRQFDIERASKYVLSALEWERQNSK